MTRDPLGERSDPNLYRFVGNSPNNFVDPLGLEIVLGGNWLRFFPRLGMPKPPANWPKPPGWAEDWQWRYPEGTSDKCPQPRWFDPKNGEWRWHAPDKYHPDGHWDYNPWDQWNSPWRNVSPSVAPISPAGSSGFSNNCYATGMCI